MEIMKYEGYHGNDATCGICVYFPKGKAVVIALLELPENKGSSITNRAERCHYKAWEKLGKPWPCHFVECYSRDHSPNVDYDRVIFKETGGIMNRPVETSEDLYIKRKNKRLIKFSEPNWYRMATQEFKELITGTDGIEAKDEAANYVFD